MNSRAHQSIISLQFTQINENALETWANKLNSTSSNGYEYTICCLIWIHQQQQQPRNSPAEKKRRSVVKKFHWKWIMWYVCVFFFFRSVCSAVLIFFCSFRLISCVFVMRYAARDYSFTMHWHDLFSNVSWRIFARINFNWIYPHFS